MDTDRHLARPIINMVTVSPNIILNTPRLNSTECNGSSIAYENPANATLGNCGFSQLPSATTLPSPVISGSLVIAEPIPVATIAAVTRLNNEMITTTALNIHPMQQQHHQSQPLHTLEPQQHQQYYQWMQHYQHQHQHQQEQIQQQYQHQQPPKPPYYNLHEYQAAPTNNPLQDYSLQSANYGSSLYQNETYKIPTHISIPEHGSIIKPAPIGYKEQQQQQPQLQQQQQQSHPLALPIDSFTHQDVIKQQQLSLQNTPQPIARDNKQRYTLNARNPSLIDNTINAASKPYATATPFYAHAYSEQRDVGNSYYENFKMKGPTDLQVSFANNPNSLANQSHKFYTAAKSQLQEHNFGSMAPTPPIAMKPFPNAIQYNNTANNFYPYVNGSSCEKYIYPSVTNSHTDTFSPTVPPRLPANDLANEVNYRKNSTLSNLSNTWPWTSDHLAYSNRNRVATTSANRIPTATVAPTHTNYLNQNSTNIQKNPYNPIHDLSPPVHSLSYQKPFSLSPNATSNYNNWYNSSHTPHMQASKDRLPYQLAANAEIPTPTPYSPMNGATSQLETNFYPNKRQQCCSQLQNYYYQTPALPDVRSANITEFSNTSPHIPSYESANHMLNINQSCRYQGHTINDIKSPLDVYPTPPFEAFDTILHENQSPTNTPIYQPVVHGLNASHSQTVDHSNDLNQVTNVINTFMTPPPSHINSTIVPQSIPPAAKQSFEPTPTKCALKDYRKPNIEMEVCQTAQNSYLNVTHENYSENNSLKYSLPAENFTNSIPNNNRNDSVELSSEKLSDAGVKNLSLRDFIANWNDDEDDGPNAEQVNFLQAADNFLAEASQTNTIHSSASDSTSRQTNTYNCANSSEVHESITNNSLNALKELASNASNGPCINLPDILIDIEKSNTVGLNTSIPRCTSPSAQLTLEKFDFEKELDELQTNKSVKNEDLTDNNNKLTETNTSKDVLDKTLPLNTENNNESVDNNLCVAFIKAPTTDFIMDLEPPCLPIDLNTKVEKTIQSKEELDHLENSSNTNHNANSFEKEYHIFINKINTQNNTQPSITKECPAEEEKLSESSKLTKRKRNHKNSNVKKIIREESTHLTDILPSTVIRNLGRKHHPYSRLRKPYRMPSFYYQLIHRIRMMKGSKRLFHNGKNMSKYLPCNNKWLRKLIQHPVRPLRSPQNLQQLCVQLFNRKEFRQVFHQYYYRFDSSKDENSSFSSSSMKTVVSYSNQEQNVFDNTSEEKQEEEEHICKDPYCDTCDVIKTLMQSQSYEVDEESVVIQDDINKVNEESYTQENYANSLPESTDFIKADNPIDHIEDNSIILNSFDNEDIANQMKSPEDSFETENNKTNSNSGNTMSLTKDEPLNIAQNSLKITKERITENTGNSNLVDEKEEVKQDIGTTFPSHDIEQSTFFQMGNDFKISGFDSVQDEPKAAITSPLESSSRSITTTELNENETNREPYEHSKRNDEIEASNKTIDNPINKETYDSRIQSPSHSPLNLSTPIRNVDKDDRGTDSHMESVGDNSSTSFIEDFIGFQQFPYEQEKNRRNDFQSFDKIYGKNQYEEEKASPMNRKPSIENISMHNWNSIKTITVNDLTEESSNSSSTSSASSKSSNSISSSSSDSNSSTTSSDSSDSGNRKYLPLTPTKELQQETILPKSPKECRITSEINENEICKEELGLQNNPNLKDIPPVKEVNKSMKEMKDSIQTLDNGQRNDEDQSANLKVNLSHQIPKLSDLCQTALNGLPSQQLPILKDDQNNDNKSVEEALEEMYREAGITIDDEPIASDDINTKDSEIGSNSNEGDTMILVNLHDILNNDANEVYVLQCDVNENILGIIESIPHNQNDDDDDDDKANVGSNHNNDNELSPTSVNETNSTDNTVQVHNNNDNFNELKPDNTNGCTDHPFVTNQTVADAANDNDNDNDDDHDDLSLIHHEEIVPDNYMKYLREEFFKYLHEKYIQRHSTKFHHANRILKKYRKLVNNNNNKSR